MSFIRPDLSDPSPLPTQNSVLYVFAEVTEYARMLGIDPDEEPGLLWIAKEGLEAPLPQHWKPWSVWTIQ